MFRIRYLAVSGFVSLLWAIGWGTQVAMAQAGAPVAPAGSDIGPTAVAAPTLMGAYTTGAVIYTILIGFLVTFLLVSAFLVLNLGLMSKRSRDRIGGRTPSDVGILKSNLWPQEEEEETRLPASENDEHEEEGKGPGERAA